MKGSIKGNMVSTWRMSYAGMCQATSVLNQTGNIHQAILTSVKAVENNEEYVSVGYGGLPNFDGEVELDAAYMNGDTLGFGGVISVNQIQNPIEVAYDLSKYKRNCLLAASGAMRYAQKKGFAFRNMLTDKAKERYEKEKMVEVNMELLEAYGGHDTVCVMGKSPSGTIACGVSTSGLFLKLPGRVGDSPVIGSGFYADSEIGSAAATGVGEDIMKGCLSYSIVERIKMGIRVQEACDDALQEHINRMERSNHKVGSISVIAMDKEGNIGASTNKVAFPFVVSDETSKCQIYIAEGYGGSTRIFLPDEAWLDQYNGD